ncbi:uricase [Nadsonia fulvescens var. elongata DSM 6958]|uniref:Uricase n=1 Tax=Nadsonia fulvescens var. elongata DSM 6958 TaxID=857566 RepID=A0A1E3PPW7_9ASCO|nr:uricase [Nadsonia fulvescens var. elongata DSM 6958]
MSVSSRCYGKDNVRVLKVERDVQDPNLQYVQEMTCCVLLDGDIETSYTAADNSVIVPTDTVKNTIYIMAKKTPGVWPIEYFAGVLGQHFIDKYAHISRVEVTITQHKWSRYAVNGKPHAHSFVRDGTEKRSVKLVKDRKLGFKVTSGLFDLSVLKSTGSMFHGFNQCDFTILKETWDRILSTDITAGWTWSPAKLATLSDFKRFYQEGIFDRAYKIVLDNTLTTFALENSASVQATMYNMAQLILGDVVELDSVTYELPNKHFFEINLDWHHGLKNTGTDAEVYAPQSDPNGLIKCTVSRNKSKL